MNNFTSPMHSHILLIPNWIEDTLNRHQIPLVEVLNIGKIRSVLSMNDLVGLVKVQTSPRRVYNHPIYSDIFLGALDSTWYLNAAKVEDKEFVTHKLQPLLSTNLEEEEYLQRLFPSDIKEESKDFFKIVPLQDKALAVVLKPVSLQTFQHPSTQFNLLRSILKQLYVYEKHTAIARLPLMERYLELLSVQKH